MKTERVHHVTADQPKSLINWYAVGEQGVLQVGEIRVVIRLVGRKGRRVRIAVSASPNVLLDGDAEV